MNKTLEVSSILCASALIAGCAYEKSKRTKGTIKSGLLKGTAIIATSAVVLATAKFKQLIPTTNVILNVK